MNSITTDQSDHEEVDLSFLTCPICTEIFKKPVILKCNHIFCKKCLKEWLKMNKTCPECRLFVKRKYVHKNKELTAICNKFSEAVKNGLSENDLAAMTRRYSGDLSGNEVSSRLLNETLGRDSAYVRQRLPANGEDSETTRSNLKDLYVPTEQELRAVDRRTRRTRRLRVSRRLLRWLTVALMGIGFILILVLI